MNNLLQTTDPVVISFAEALLREAGIEWHVADVNVSSVEGSIGIFPRRLLVRSEQWQAARQILVDAGLEAWVAK
jgi:hypothetical protein